MNCKHQSRNSHAGFTILEVVLAIAVFAFGLLALIELQTGIARSSGDANLRTVAASIAEEIVEDARSFSTVEQYDNDIVSKGPDDWGETFTVIRDEGAGVSFEVNMIVQDYYWDADTERFVTTRPEGIVRSDYKSMDIVVMWRELEGDETFDDHGSIDFSGEGGGIRIVEAVPSSPPVLGAMVASSRDILGGPQVTYLPGENPDIIRLTLDAEGGKFKEATTPAPDVIRDDKVETWFDVVTYSQLADSDAVFLRREEFAAITCICELETAPTADNYGLKPTLWNGVDYTEGEKVNKPIGRPVGPSSAQSQFCGVCCRDHHDGASGADIDNAENFYKLENVGSAADHPHYDRDRRGDIVVTPVGDGDEYLEACRLIRKDGFMRVTQDANQGALLGFPEGYLDADGGAADYSEYVVEAAGDYYGLGLEAFPQPRPEDPDSTHEFPARTPETATTLPTAFLTKSQQLRARGVYTDYLTAAAQNVIDECFPIDERTADCRAPNTSTPFEIYPFFDVQLTLLSRWNEQDITGLVELSNEPVESGNTHSRGLIALISDELGRSDVVIDSQKGNLGLTSTGAIDPLYDLNQTIDRLYVNVNDGDLPPPPIGARVSGSLTSGVRRVPAADLLLESSGALCGVTDTEWACVVTTPGAKLRVSNYYLNMPRTYACSELAYLAESVGPPAENHFTEFELPWGGEADIWITDDFTICDR